MHRPSVYEDLQAQGVSRRGFLKFCGRASSHRRCRWEAHKPLRRRSAPGRVPASYGCRCRNARAAAGPCRARSECTYFGDRAVSINASNVVHVPTVLTSERPLLPPVVERAPAPLAGIEPLTIRK